jgi:hypothetical protein
MCSSLFLVFLMSNQFFHNPFLSRLDYTIYIIIYIKLVL